MTHFINCYYNNKIKKDKIRGVRSMGDMRNEYIILARKPERKNEHISYRRRSEDDIKTDLKLYRREWVAFI
jgi:hypothetical protein